MIIIWWNNDDFMIVFSTMYYKLLKIQSRLSTIMVLLTIVVWLSTMLQAKIGKSGEESVELKKVGSITPKQWNMI